MTSEVAVFGADPSAIESADPAVAAAMVTKALEESRSWLAVAMQGTDPTPIAEFKAWAATVEEATKQKNLGREIELDAAEMVRRAERGIGVAIRKGQEAGEIANRADGGWTARARNLQSGNTAKEKPSPTDFVAAHELSSNGAGIYAVTDNVTDEQFDAAVTQAKAEGNLSRANVVRKVKGEKPKPTGRPEILRRTRHIDPNRVVEETVNAANPDVGGVLDLVDFTQLDDDRLGTWISSLSSHIKGLRTLRSQLEKELNRRVSG